MGIRKEQQFDYGFIHIVTASNTTMRKINVGTLGEINFEDYTNLTDIYYTPNTFSSPIRRTRENLWQLHRFYIDIDHKKNTRAIDNFEIVIEIEKLVESKVIPKPTQYIYSGRGIHVYWDINSCHVMLIDLWEKIEDYLYHAIKQIEKSIDNISVDKRATNPAILLRVPNTINSRSREKCYSMFKDESTSYNIFDLKKQYIIPNRKKESNNKNKLAYLPTKNLYTLNASRLIDFEKIVELRNFDVEGYRNTLIMLYSYHYRLINNVTVNELIKVTKKFNKTFKKPYKVKELIYVCRSVNRTVKYFIKDNTKGYKFSNKYIIEALNITESEQKQLLTIISKSEKYNRNNTRRSKKRRNDDGLTSREVKKNDIRNAVQSLKNQGLTQKEIAIKLNKSVRTIKRHWNV